jgi:hypothetical protein
MLRHQEIRIEKNELFKQLEEKTIKISDYVHKINDLNAELHECETIIDHIMDICKIFPMTSLESVCNAKNISDVYSRVSTEYFWDVGDCEMDALSKCTNIILLDFLIDSKKEYHTNTTLSVLAGDCDNDILVDRLKEKGLFEIYEYTQGCRNIEQFKKINDISQPSLNKCLINACVRANTPLVEYLVNRGANNLDAGLFKCNTSRHIALSEVLINMGARASDRWMTAFKKSNGSNDKVIRKHILKMMRKEKKQHSRSLSV